MEKLRLVSTTVVYGVPRAHFPPIFSKSKINTFSFCTSSVNLKDLFRTSVSPREPRPAQKLTLQKVHLFTAKDPSLESAHRELSIDTSFVS